MQVQQLASNVSTCSSYGLHATPQPSSCLAYDIVTLVPVMTLLLDTLLTGASHLVCVHKHVDERP